MVRAQSFFRLGSVGNQVAIVPPDSSFYCNPTPLYLQSHPSIRGGSASPDSI